VRNVKFEGGFSAWLAGALDLSQRRQRAALLALIGEGERRIATLHAQYDALGAPPALLETLHRVLGDATGKIAASDIWAAIDKPDACDRTQRDNQELGRAMRRLGWNRTMQRFDGWPRSAYVRGSREERRRPLHLLRCPITGEWELG
jgi:hypothetical protein